MVKMPGTPFEISIFALEVADSSPWAGTFGVPLDPSQGNLGRRTFPGSTSPDKNEGGASGLHAIRDVELPKPAFSLFLS